MSNDEPSKNVVKIEVDFSQENINRVKIVDVKPNQDKLDVEIQYKPINYNSEMLLTFTYFFICCVANIS